MGNLKDYVLSKIDSYSLNEQTTIKSILYYINAEEISLNDYITNTMKREIGEVNSKEVIDYLIINSPFGYNYKKNKVVEGKGINKVKKQVLTKRIFDIDDEDEIFNI